MITKFSIHFNWDAIPNKVKQYMMNVNDWKILSSNFKIQDFNTDTCELYSILNIVLLNNKIQY